MLNILNVAEECSAILGLIVDDVVACDCEGKTRPTENFRIDCEYYGGLKFSYFSQASGVKDRPTNHRKYLDYACRVQCCIERNFTYL